MSLPDCTASVVDSYTIITLITVNEISQNLTSLNEWYNYGLKTRAHRKNSSKEFIKKTQANYDSLSPSQEQQNLHIDFIPGPYGHYQQHS